MSVWDVYQGRIEASGESKRKASFNREVRYLNNKLRSTLSYHLVDIDGVKREVAITDSDNLNEKTIYSMPEEDIRCGSLVSWMGQYWLVTERDANSEIYCRAKLTQCNHLLKWVDDDDVIHEQWCVIEDGTKYLTGEYEDRKFIVTRGDSRIAMTIARNEDTVKFCRESRFLIDDPDSTDKLAYLLTKPLKTGLVYQGDGVYKFVLQEVVSTPDDDMELGIADYYKHFPKNPYDEASKVTEGDPIIDPDNNIDDNGKRVWL